jgi:hypothetical protein
VVSLSPLEQSFPSRKIPQIKNKKKQKTSEEMEVVTMIALRGENEEAVAN